MRKDALPDNTRRLLEVCETIPEMERFLLIGGTALALHAAHRFSEDLDFISAESKLDRRLVDRILKRFDAMGLPRTEKVNLFAEMDMEESGLDLNDYQQDWEVVGTKVTFVVASPGSQTETVSNAKSDNLGHVRVARPETVFDLKALAISDRMRSRDVYDIWWFVEHGGRTIADLAESVERLRKHYPFDSVKGRLLYTRPPSTDEGFVPIMPTAPRDLDGIRAALARRVDEYEIGLAQAAAVRKASFELAVVGVDALRALGDDAVIRQVLADARMHATGLAETDPQRVAFERVAAKIKEPSVSAVVPAQGTKPPGL